MNLRTSYPYAVSIIVVSYNTRDLLRDCLKSLLAECARLPQGHAAEVLVVDNASSDGSPEMVAREFSNSRIPVRLIRSDVNLGFGAANNLALNKAQGQYPVLLNSDAFFHPGSLHHCHRSHERQPLRRRRRRSPGQSRRLPAALGPFLPFHLERRPDPHRSR
jgi:GT2 family glycosyltransferase